MTSVARRHDELVPRETIDAALLDWLGSESSYFHLVGSPGTGKTSWAKLMAARDGTDLAGGARAKLVARHFCQRDQAASWSALRFLKRASEQISEAEPIFGEAVLRLAAQGGRVTVSAVQKVSDSPGASAINIKIEQLVLHGVQARDAIEPLLLTPLREVLEGDGPTWIMLVDAVDEAQTTQEDTSLRELLLSLGELPSRARIVLTSRPDALLERELDRLGAVRLDLGTGRADLAALHSFIRQRARSTGLMTKIAAGTKAKLLLEAIVERARGNFLAGRCAVDMLAKSPEAVTLKAVAELPTDLASLYLHFLSRLPGPVRDAWPDRGGRIAGALAVAREPLNEQQLELVTGLAASALRHAMLPLRQYLTEVEAPAGAWRIFHQTFTEFLGDRRQAQEFWTPPKEQHERFARWAECDWANADPYIVRHAVPHIVAAQGSSPAERIDRLLTPAYLGARLKLGPESHRIVDDLALAIRAACDEADVARVYFFTVLKILWHDKAATQAEPASAILLAARGRVAESLKLAAGQEVGGPTPDYTVEAKYRSFARDLAEMGERDAAVEFVEGLEGSGRDQALAGAVEAFAPKHPKRALDLLARISGETMMSRLISVDTCRHLARLPEGVDRSWACAGDDPPLQLAVAEGCASHDLDRAFDLIRLIQSHQEDIGGERLAINAPDMNARVLAAFVAADGRPAKAAWKKALPRSEYERHKPDALRLAIAMAAASPDLGVAAFKQLSLKHDFLSGALAASAMGSAGGPELFTALVALFPSDLIWPPDHIFTGIRVSAVCPMLDVVDIDQIVDAPYVRPLVETFVDRLLKTLAANPERPEMKGQITRTLGRLCARLDDKFVRDLGEIVTEEWNESGDTEGAIGVAMGLAERSTEAFLQGLGCRLFPGLDHHVPQMSAAQVIAERDPEDALRLFENIPPRFFASRAELAGIIAKQMRIQGRGDLSSLSDKLTSYIEGAHFLDVARKLERASSRQAEAAALSAPEPPIRALHLIMSGEATGQADPLREAARLIEGLEPLTGTPMDGQFLRPKGLRSRLAKALADVDPELALDVALPNEDIDELRPLAAKVLAGNGDLAQPARLAEFIGEKVAAAKPAAQTNWFAWKVCLAFALALRDEERDRFLNAFDEVTEEYVSLAARAFSNPGGVLTEIAERRRDLFSSQFAGQFAIIELAKQDPVTALGLIDEVAPDYAVESYAEHVARAWPLRDWQSALRAFAGTKYEQACARIVLARAGAIDPLGASEMLAQVPAVNRSYALEDIIAAAAAAGTASGELWTGLTALTDEIVDAAAKRNALKALMVGVENLAPAERKHAACVTLAAIAHAPREILIQEAGATLRAAKAAEPGLDGAAVSDRLRALLAVEA